MLLKNILKLKKSYPTHYTVGVVFVILSACSSAKDTTPAAPTPPFSPASQPETPAQTQENTRPPEESPQNKPARPKGQLADLSYSQLLEVLGYSQEVLGFTYPDALPQLTIEQVRSLPVDAFEHPEIRWAQKLLPAQVCALTPDQLKAIRPSNIRYFNFGQECLLTSEQAGAFSIEQFKALNSISVFTIAQIRAFSPEFIAASGFSGVSDEKIKALPAEFFGARGLRGMSQSQLQALTKKQLTALTGDQLKTEYVAQLTPEQQSWVPYLGFVE